MSWPIVKLGEIIELNPPGPRPGSYSDNDLFDFVPMASVSEQGYMAVSEQRPYSDVKKGFTAFKNDDVILAKITPCFENNKITRVDVTTDYAFGSTEFHVLRCKSGKVDPDYLAYFLRQDSVRKSAERRMTGSGGQRRVPKAFLEELQIPLPPLDEQKRIAAILDQADDLRRLRARALEKLNTLGQAIFHEMFGNISEWQPLSEIVTEFRYGTSNKAGSGGYPTLRIPNVVAGSLNLAEIKTVEVTPAEEARLRLKTGDLLFVRTNGNPDNVGRCACFDPSSPKKLGFGDVWIYASYLIRARLVSTANPDFVAFYINSPEGRKSIQERIKTSAGQYNLNTEGLGSLMIPKVPFAQQLEFSDKVSSFKEPIDAYISSYAATEALFASLQSAAFQGKL